MKNNYSYPMDFEWSQAELVKVMNMWTIVEDVYEKGVAASEINSAHQAFKEVVKSIGEERALGNEFEEVSGYSLYRVIQAAKKSPDKRIKL